MTKDEIMKMLDRNIKDAITTAEVESCKSTGAWYHYWYHYYYGVAEGLRQAKEIVGMLDKKNKISE